MSVSVGSYIRPLYIVLESNFVIGREHLYLELLDVLQEHQQPTVQFCQLLGQFLPIQLGLEPQQEGSEAGETIFGKRAPRWSKHSKDFFGHKPEGVVAGCDEDGIGDSENGLEADTFLANSSSQLRRLFFRAATDATQCLDIRSAKANLVDVETYSSVSVRNFYQGLRVAELAIVSVLKEFQQETHSALVQIIGDSVFAFVSLDCQPTELMA